jgi:hypothetical protein
VEVGESVEEERRDELLEGFPAAHRLRQAGDMKQELFRVQFVDRSGEITAVELFVVT